MGYWKTNTNASLDPHWGMSASSYLQRKTDSDDYERLEYHDDSLVLDPDKTYIYSTEVTGFTSYDNNSLRIKSNYDNDFFNIDFASAAIDDNIIYYISSPDTEQTDSLKFIYSATDSFSGENGIENISIKEMEWMVNGYLWINAIGIVDPICEGWIIKEDSVEFYSADYNLNTYPVGGNNKDVNENYRNNNFISRFIPHPYFNLTFDYQRSSGSTQSNNIQIYLSEEEPYNGPSQSLFENFLDNSLRIDGFDGNDFANFTGATSVGFWQLKGNQYITIIGETLDIIQNGGDYSVLKLKNLKIEGSYHKENNNKFEVDSSNLEVVGLTNATFSYIVGFGNTFKDELPDAEVTSNIGNGVFLSGTWENGVWNNGWREDNELKEFYYISDYINISNKKWEVTIVGSTQSVSNFEINDMVSIGNIVAINTNEERKFLKESYKIVEVDPTSISDRLGSIKVEITSNFPFRRIKKDSENHRIYITKNIWLNGAFLNGYFKGVWSDGLLKGYPYLTEIENSQWIKGRFEGGHFKSRYYINGDFSDTFFYQGKVGLTFSSPHNLIEGDIITIDKDDKSINPSYDGETEIINILDDYKIITNIDWLNDSTGESGSYTTNYTTGVIQDMEFKSLNTAPRLSIQTNKTENVFVYDSWIDVEYDNTSAVNIGKPQSGVNEFSKKSVSKNNLYGYPTNDVLSSRSIFRDSFSFNERTYNLGTKYKIYNDFMGDASKFEEYFNTNDNVQPFLDQGWSFSYSNISNISFTRTTDGDIDPRLDNIISGKELKVESENDGGVLDISEPNYVIKNRNNQDIEKSRYSLIKFDLLTHSSTASTNFYAEITFDSGVPIIYAGSPIHFDNLNYRREDDGWEYDVHLPVYKNINHLVTPDKQKIEYFFNKTNLSMNFLGVNVDGGDKLTTYIDNLKFVEVDMIPFFKYWVAPNIDKGAKEPYTGKAPYIRYRKTTFNFIDKINFGFDSYEI